MARIAICRLAKVTKAQPEDVRQLLEIFYYKTARGVERWRGLSNMKHHNLDISCLVFEGRGESSLELQPDEALQQKYFTR